jgi:Predicted outer membrane protein
MNSKIKDLLPKTKQKRCRQWKAGKKWLYCAGTLTILGGVGVTVALTQPQFLGQVVHALSLPPGASQVGTINGAPVVKSPSNDMSSGVFKDIISSLVEGMGTPPFVVNQVAWGGSSSLANGKDISTFGQTPTAVFGADGFLPTDKAVLLDAGKQSVIYNVGSALDTSSGQQVPISLGITFLDAQAPGGGALNQALLGAKSQNGVITLAWGSPSDGGENGGGSSEGGGTGGGNTDGSGLYYIENVSYRLTLINSNTGKPLPDTTLMPIKMSDIDASQLATMDGNGAKGYILSPDTVLSQSGNGFQAAPGGAINEDTKALSANSYMVLKQWNSNSVQYQYTDGVNNHMDIVTGVFGNTPWNLSDLLGGYIQLDKTTLQFGDTLPNGNYNFKDLVFDVIDKNGKVVDTIKLNDKGEGKSKRIPSGTYTLREQSGKWSATGQTILPDFTTTVTPGDTTTVKPKNTAVTGQLTIKKKGVESGDAMWNPNYTLAGNKFKVTSITDGKTYTVTTDAKGIAVLKDLPLGEYLVEETNASPGFTNTFKPQKVTLSYKDQNTEVVFGDTAGTNQEVKGQNTLEKVDKETGTTQDGKGQMKDAKYAYFYADDSTGSSPHKANDPIKWGDKPGPKLLIGDKVTSAVIGGEKVDFGDKVVIDVDDTKLQAALGNLPVGKYYSQEVDAGEGYVVDSTKHYFEIKKKDDETSTIITPNTKSEEQLIKAMIDFRKVAQVPGGSVEAGINGVEITATSMTGKSAPVKMVTHTNKETGEDGYGKGVLPYDDWEVKETKGVPGYSDIKPFYIHMVTDTSKDLLLITASYSKDFSDPFTKRTFSLTDNSNSENPNADDSVSGEVDESLPLISLTPFKFTDGTEPPVPPTPPVVPPTKDVTKTDGGDSIDGGNVALNSDFVYVLNSSVLPAGRTEEMKKWTIDDDFDESYDKYNGTYNVYATTAFGDYKKGDKLPQDFFTGEEKDGHVIFKATSKFLKVVNENMDKAVGYSIHADFYRYKDSEEVDNTFVEVTNNHTEDSNQVDTHTKAPEPHKFDLDKPQYDISGDSLLDDDGEMNDRYGDSNNNPYLDDPINNEDHNINTAEVERGQTLYYQLWLDTTPFDKTSELTQLRMVDDYDEERLTTDVSKVKVYDKSGHDVTSYFKVEDVEGKLIISANVFIEATNSSGKKVQVVDTSKISLGQYYKIDAPMTVKDDVEDGVDIINTAAQEWTDSDGTDNSHITEKRVNHVPSLPTKDVTKTDGGESIDGDNIALNSDFVYVLNSSVIHANRIDDKTSWVIDDDFDEKFDRYNGSFKVYATTDFGDYKKGDVLPEDFFVGKEEKGHAIFSAQQKFLDVVNEHKDQAVGFSIHADFYRYKDSQEVDNVFDEIVNDVKEKSNEVTTHTPKPEPHKFDLSESKFDLTGDKLLDDDKEMNDRYADSNNNPYADKTDNNEKENINTQKVKAGQVLNYQLWLDTTPFDATSELTQLRMVDDYDEKALDVKVTDVRVYDAKGKDVTSLFYIAEANGKLSISANVFTEALNSKGEKVKIVDTKRLPLGQVYKIDAPMTVKEGLENDYDIVNTARQEWTDSDGTDNAHETEKRVNKIIKNKVTPPVNLEEPPVLQKMAELHLPRTGEASSTLLMYLGGATLLGTLAYTSVRAYRKKKGVTESLDPLD